MRRAASEISLAFTCATPAPAISTGAPTARCDSSTRVIHCSRTEEPPLGPTSAIEAPVEQLDLATVIKVSQAASSEIEFEKLIDTLMRTAIEQAGAERGFLALARGSELRIAAEATTSGDQVIVRVGDQSMSEVALPESVLNYVQRTRDNVILDDAAAGSPFAEDPHIRHRHARSILCLPLIKQAKLVGVLYLENSLAPRVFAPARIPVLKLLASQAAISLENTDLYRKLAEREARIRRMIDADIIGIFIWNFDGRILEANNAFLRIVGYEREDLLSGRLSWRDMTPVEWVDPRDKQWLQELRRTGTVRPYEKEYFRKDGSRVLVLIGEATFEEGGDEGVSFVLDLTERQHAEEALRRSEAYLAESQRLSHTGTSIFNATGTLYWSEESYRIWGLDPLQGLPDHETVWQRIHPDDRDRVRALVLGALREKREYVVDFRIVLPDGAVKHLASTAHPFLAAHGGHVEIVATQVDVTERVRAQDQSEKLRQLELDLAHLQSPEHDWRVDRIASSRNSASHRHRAQQCSCRHTFFGHEPAKSRRSQGGAKLYRKGCRPGKRYCRPRTGSHQESASTKGPTSS